MTYIKNKTILTFGYDGIIDGTSSWSDTQNPIRLKCTGNASSKGYILPFDAKLVSASLRYNVVSKSLFSNSNTDTTFGFFLLDDTFPDSLDDQQIIGSTLQLGYNNYTTNNLNLNINAGVPLGGLISIVLGGTSNQINNVSLLAVLEHI